MRRIRIAIAFVDKYDHSRLYKVGDVVPFDDKRADYIEYMGLGTPEHPAVETKEHTPDPEPVTADVDVKDEGVLTEVLTVVGDDTPEHPAVDAKPVRKGRSKTRQQ